MSQVLKRVKLVPQGRRFIDQYGQLWIQARGTFDACCVCGEWCSSSHETMQAQTRLHQIAHVGCVTVEQGAYRPPNDAA